MSIKEIKKGISAYEPAQKEILKFIKAHGGKITSADYDIEFSHSGRFLPVNNLSQETFILGSINQGIHGQWIHLIRLMVEAKMLKRRIYKKLDKVYYYLN